MVPTGRTLYLCKSTRLCCSTIFQYTINEQVFRSSLPPVPLVRKSIFTHLLGASPNTPHLVGSFPASSPAFIDATTGVTISRGQLRSLALQLAYSLVNLPEPLRHQGNGAATTRPTVLVFSPNSIVWPIMLLGASAAGFTTTLANSSHNPDELKHQYIDAGAHLIFVHPSLLDTTKKMLTSIGCTDMHARIIVATSGWLTGVPDTETADTSGFARLENLLGRGQLTCEVNFDGERSEETAYLCYSSGTTGKPKGVQTTHYNVTSVIEMAKPLWPNTRPCLAPSLADAVGPEQPDVVLGPLPYFHIYGMVKLLLLPLAVCTPSVVISGFVPETFLGAIEKYRGTGLMIVPPILLAFARHEAIDNYDLSSVRTIMCAAAPLNRDLILTVKKRFETAGFNVAVVQGYGLTETSPTVFILPDKYAYHHPGSVGVTIPNLEVRLAREDSGEVLTDIEGAGELWVRGPNVMKGYLNDSSATVAAITEDGWFKTGDIAVRNEDGFFTIVDRRKELIKYKVLPPAELESLLLQHPDVADAAVIGVPSEEATELPRAYVVPAQPVAKEKAATFASDIQQWVAQKVAPQKKLRGGVVLVERIPKSASGKILRRELRDRAVSDIAYGQVGVLAKL
ncbi:AMP binding protein [Pisolithus marmoratus]|nr:AMP binding protein [Pisolithus marmoratus]